MAQRGDLQLRHYCLPGPLADGFGTVRRAAGSPIGYDSELWGSRQGL